MAAAERPEPSSPAGSEDREADGAKVQLGLVLVGLVLAAVLWGARGSPRAASAAALEPGAIVDAPITLVTADRHELACAMAEPIQGYACVWSTPESRREPAPAPERVLAPYLTTSGQQFLVAGLFEQPAVAQRYDRENPTGRKREELRRFTATCKLKLLGELEAKVQFAPGGPWEGPSKIWAAAPMLCAISHP